MLPAPFARVVDEDDGDAVATLQLAQVGEQRGDLAADVFVDAMQPHERVEDELARLQSDDGFVEAGAIGVEVEAQAGCGDHLDVEVGQVEAGGGANTVEPAAHDVQRILRGVEQDAAGIGHGEAAQAGCAGGDRDGEIESEEGFAAFRLAADDADGLLGPQPAHQPALLLGSLGEAMGRRDRKRVHRRPLSRVPARPPTTALG